MELKIKIQTRLPKGSHKGRQMAHNLHTGKYARQALRTAANKDAARKKHLVEHPNDLQAIKALQG